MVLWNLGSAATEILSLVPDVPTSISGTTLEGMVDRKRLYMESYTGQNIGSVAIDEKFQPALINLTTSDLMGFMNLQGADASEVKLGDFTVKKGGDSNLITSQKGFHDQGMAQLRQLGRTVRFKKANG